MWLHNLTKSFGGKVAVDRVGITVEKGEFLTLLGPSGCGKTTTLRLVAGFIVPDDGEIAVGGKIVASARGGIFVPARKRGMAMVFQSYAIWPHMSVFENIAYGLRVRKLQEGDVKKRVMAALDKVRLTEFAKRSPNQLSGGEQQRVALARALVVEPEVLLFDEPLSNLDAKLREEMRFEIRDLQRKLGITTFYVTHDQAEAMAISDRIAVMNGGRIHQVGSPYEIYRYPADRFVASFVGLANLIEGQVTGLNENNMLIDLETGNSIRTPLLQGAGRGSHVLISIRPEDIDITDIEMGGNNSIAAKVERIAFLGSVVDFQVSVGDRSIRVHSAAPSKFEIGSPVALTFKENQCKVIPL